MLPKSGWSRLLFPFLPQTIQTLVSQLEKRPLDQLVSEAVQKDRRTLLPFICVTVGLVSAGLEFVILVVKSICCGSLSPRCSLTSRSLQDSNRSLRNSSRTLGGNSTHKTTDCSLQKVAAAVIQSHSSFPIAGATTTLHEHPYGKRFLSALRWLCLSLAWDLTD